MREINPDVQFVFYGSGGASRWNDLFPDDDMQNVILDNHAYMAWYGRRNDVGSYCDEYSRSIRDN